MYKQHLHESIKPGIYICKETRRGIIVNEDLTYFPGTIKTKNGKYIYLQYRNGDKVIQKYLGKEWPPYWIRDDKGYF